MPVWTLFQLQPVHLPMLSLGLFTSTPHSIPCKPLAAFPITFAERKVRGEGRMSHVAMTITSLWKEIDQARD